MHKCIPLLFQILYPGYNIYMERRGCRSDRHKLEDWMRAVAMLLAMLFMHIVDDYYLQGILAKMKQKSWWEEQVPDLDTSIYKNDYKMALCEHAFSWTCCVLALPALVWGVPWWLLLPLVAANTVIHAIVDGGKANDKVFNLVEDQLLHVGQVLASWLVIMLWRTLSW